MDVTGVTYTNETVLKAYDDINELLLSKEEAARRKAYAISVSRLEYLIYSELKLRGFLQWS